MTGLRVIYVTASNKGEAANIGRELIKNRLAACVNICDGVTSIYRWEGKEEESGEAVLFIKTKASLVEDVKRTVRKMHSYSCPCIIVLPATDADKDYAEWIMKETK